jgi:hypothetical protein
LNIIFLDIDGVLNDFEQSWSPTRNYRPEILPRCVKALNRIVDEARASLVLSSAWRNLILAGHMSVSGFGVMLRTHGVRGELLGHTRADIGDEERWQQISDWLKSPQRCCGRPVEVSRYCILDDRHEAFGGRPGIHTNGGHGLTMAQARRAIRILSKKVAA